MKLLTDTINGEPCVIVCFEPKDNLHIFMKHLLKKYKDFERYIYMSFIETIIDDFELIDYINEDSNKINAHLFKSNLSEYNVLITTKDVEEDPREVVSKINDMLSHSKNDVKYNPAELWFHIIQHLILHSKEDEELYNKITSNKGGLVPSFEEFKELSEENEQELPEFNEDDFPDDLPFTDGTEIEEELSDKEILNALNSVDTLYRLDSLSVLDLLPKTVEGTLYLAPDHHYYIYTTQLLDDFNCKVVDMSLLDTATEIGDVKDFK